MAISEEEVLYIASLARLSLTPQERVTLAREMGVILDYMRTLDTIDTERVPPMVRASDSQQAVREDVVRPRINLEDALRNEPDGQGDYFRVPRVVG